MSSVTVGSCDRPIDPTSHARRRHAGLLFGLVAAVIWGAFLTVSRHGVGKGLRGSDLAFLRYATAGLLLLPVLLRRSPWSVGGIGWRRGMVLALLAGPLFVLVGASGYPHGWSSQGPVMARYYATGFPALP